MVIMKHAFMDIDTIYLRDSRDFPLTYNRRALYM